MAAAKTYIVAQGRGPVLYNGDRFEDGDKIAVDGAAAAQLLSVGAIFDPADRDGDGVPDIVEAQAARKRRKAAEADEG